MHSHLGKCVTIHVLSFQLHPLHFISSSQKNASSNRVYSEEMVT